MEDKSCMSIPGQVFVFTEVTQGSGQGNGENTINSEHALSFKMSFT